MLFLVLLCASILSAHTAIGPLKVVILYPLIPVSELTLITDIVCNTNPSEAHFTVIIPDADISGFPTQCFHEVIRTAVFLELDRFQHITSSHIARMESCYQKQEHNNNMYIDTLASAMENADLVWTGPEVPVQEDLLFVKYIIDIIPLKPLVMSFSDALRNGIPDGLAYSKIFSHLVKESGYASYSKQYRFDITSSLQCLTSIPSYSCRDILPPDVNEFVTAVATATRRAMINVQHEYVTKTDPMCHIEFPTIFDTEGILVLNSLIGQNSDMRQDPTTSVANSPRVMCFTYSYEVKHEHVEAIRKTWGKRCDGYLAISNTSNPDHGILALGPIDQQDDQEGWFKQDSYSRMWTKTQLIFNLIATSSLLDDYDYFLLGGDDLFVLIDNLKEFLASDRIKSMEDQPLYIGREMWANDFTRFNSGGPGYVLNRAAALVLYRLIHDPSGNCLPTALSSMEDLFVGKCFSEAGIVPIDTRNDVDGREMFHPLTPKQSYLGENEGPKDWYKSMSLRSRSGMECCSSASVSFHYITSPEAFYCFDYLLYSYR